MTTGAVPQPVGVGERPPTRRSYSSEPKPSEPSSPFSEPLIFSDLSGSGRSQSRHWNVRSPLPPGGSARVKKAPHSEQVGRLDCPIIPQFYVPQFYCLFKIAHFQIRLKFNLRHHRDDVPE